MNILKEKFLEVIRAVTPIVVLVLIIHFLFVPLPTSSLIGFLFGAIVIVIGLAIFLMGIDIALEPIGSHMGKGIARSNKIIVVVIVGLLLGFFISSAEPSLTVLGNQIGLVTGGDITSSFIVIVVSLGIAVMVVVGLLRVVYSLSIIPILTIAYGLILLLSFFTSTEFLSISFDASGATTGSITVPFLLALSTGIASLKKSSKNSGEDSFGLVAIASTGAILSVMIVNVFSPTEELSGSLDIVMGTENGFFLDLIREIFNQIGEVIVAILPIVILFGLYQIIWLKLPKRKLNKILIGVLYVFIGLVLFLSGVNAGFMNVGSLIGYTLAAQESYGLLYILGFSLGFLSILAEPAVSVLTKQIGAVTSGAIKPVAVLSTLSIGVGLAILLSTMRLVIFDLELWHILLPGYLLAIFLSYVVPKRFVGMAFDAGGVASGPMTATFILAFIQGAAEAIPHASVLIDGFGMIALVALMPILSLQIFGLIYHLKAKQTQKSVN
ncbi:DUF1538 domain-containing protein [Marinilactibacillus sp. XAAS-LB27]|uniref:DUF1538 domain-containing protein n=1 Tax=Marinilactibacillus sp. XAAS-LB27 TaxID=3114538 RepID=UPI002E192B80|nr:DUF1538 domain-containing protein [Marinilactibacillus sp. XAAS-LB27]